MDATYDPDDQFFQAFRAGYLRYRADRQSQRPEAIERGIWELFVSWLYEKAAPT